MIYLVKKNFIEIFQFYKKEIVLQKYQYYLK